MVQWIFILILDTNLVTYKNELERAVYTGLRLNQNSRTTEIFAPELRYSNL